MIHLNLDVDKFRNIIQTYYTKPRPDPFIAWYWEKIQSGEIRDSFEKILVTLIDARFDQVTTAENALENTKRVHKAGLTRDQSASRKEIPSLLPIGDDSSEEWTEKFFLSHRTLIETSKEVLNKRKWDATKLRARVCQGGLLIRPGEHQHAPITSRLFSRAQSHSVQ